MPMNKILKLFLALICLTTISLGAQKVYADNNGPSSLSPFFEFGGTVEFLRQYEHPLYGGAFISKIGLLKRNSTGRSWGGSLTFLCSDNMSFWSQSKSEDRFWLLLQHRRPLGEGFFKYWGLSIGFQISSSLDNSKYFKFNSTPVMLETEVGAAGFLSFGLMAEFFTGSYMKETWDDSIYNESPTIKIIEDSICRLSLSVRFAFGGSGSKASRQTKAWFY